MLQRFGYFAFPVLGALFGGIQYGHDSGWGFLVLAGGAFLGGGAYMVLKEAIDNAYFNREHELLELLEKKYPRDAEEILATVKIAHPFSEPGRQELFKEKS